MLVEEVLTRLGGIGTRAELIRATSRTEVDGALRAGRVVVLGRGRYGLAGIDSAETRAHEVKGVLCLSSAALHHGWRVKTADDDLMSRSREDAACRRRAASSSIDTTSIPPRSTGSPPSP